MHNEHEHYCCPRNGDFVNDQISHASLHCGLMERVEKFKKLDFLGSILSENFSWLFALPLQQLGAHFLSDICFFISG